MLLVRSACLCVGTCGGKTYLEAQLPVEAEEMTQ